MSRFKGVPTWKRVGNPDWVHPCKGKLRKEYLGKNWIDSKRGKSRLQYLIERGYSKNYKDPRKGKTGVEIYGKNFTPPNQKPPITLKNIFTNEIKTQRYIDWIKEKVHLYWMKKGRNCKAGWIFAN